MILDEDGRLFGFVNVVDALVVVVAVALIVSGVVLVVGGGGGAGPTTTEYATVTFAVPVGSDVADVQAGDTIRQAGYDKRYNVTAVHRGFLNDTAGGSSRSPESVYLVVRLGYEVGTDANPRRFAAGERTRFDVARASVEAYVRSVDGSDPELYTQRRRAVVAVSRPGVASAVAPGDTATISDQPVATVESVDRVPGNDRVRVGLSLRTWETGAGPAFGAQTLRVGNGVTVLTDDAVVAGRVVAVGTANASDVRER